jgi:hypothetical protein
MHKITRADIVFSIGRGLIMAAAIIGASYFLGSWYFGASDLDAIYQSTDDSLVPLVAHATAPTPTEEATQ